MALRTLASLTTLRLGGPADAMVPVSDPAAWPEIVNAFSARREPAPVVLGHVSNVIAADPGHHGTAFPPPAAALRTLKSDVVVGLDAAVVAALDVTGEPWRTNGTYALNQVNAGA